MPVTLCLVSISTHAILPRNPAVAWALKQARSHIRRQGLTLASAYWAAQEINRCPWTHHGRRARAERAAWLHASRIAQASLANQRCSPPGGCYLALRT